MESYNSIILQQFDTFYRSENDKQKELAVKIHQQDVINDELLGKRIEYDRLIDQARVIVHSKETIISSLHRNQDMLDNENTLLKEQIH